jgi:hypothetical protein
MNNQKKINLKFDLDDNFLFGKNVEKKLTKNTSTKVQSNTINYLLERNTNKNKQKKNSNNLTLDLSFEDINNIISNNHAKLDKYSIKFNSDNNRSTIPINQNEINSSEIKNQLTPSINIDEESKSYIKDIIDICKEASLKGKNCNLKENNNNKKEYYKNNGYIKRLKTEDLIEIAKRRKEHMNKKVSNKIEIDSIKTSVLKTENNIINDKIINNNDVEIDNYYLKRNKTNRINIKKEYFTGFLKINNLNSKSNLCINNKMNNNNIYNIKNYYFLHNKNKNKNNQNNNNNIINEAKTKKIKQIYLLSKQKTNNERNKLISPKENSNIHRRKNITLNKDLISNEIRKNYINQSNNINISKKEKDILKKNKKKINLDLTNYINNNNNKCNYLNSDSSKQDIKNVKPSKKMNQKENISPNLINFINKNSNSKINIYNNCCNNKNLYRNKNKNKKNDNNIIHKNTSQYYLSTEIKYNCFNMIYNDKNNKGKRVGKVSALRKNIYTGKENWKSNEILKTSPNNEILSKEYFQNNYHNKSSNILNIKKLKLKANASVRDKITQKKYNFNDDKNYFKCLKLNENKKNKNGFDYTNFSIESNSINYLHQRKRDNDKNLCLNFSPIRKRDGRNKSDNNKTKK